MNTLNDASLANGGTLVMPAREPKRGPGKVGIVWARGASRQGLRLEILQDVLRIRGVRGAAFSSEERDVLVVDYDVRSIDNTVILNAVCRPGVWASFVDC